MSRQPPAFWADPNKFYITTKNDVTTMGSFSPPVIVKYSAGTIFVLYKTFDGFTIKKHLSTDSSMTRIELLRHLMVFLRISYNPTHFAELVVTAFHTLVGFPEGSD